MSLEVGQVFAGYTILRVLGAGGMGAVYLAKHPRLPREDALKVLPADLTADPDYRARFEREAELAAGLSHPHIVRIFDRGEHDGQFWISMDYVEGTDAAVLLSKHPDGIPVNEALPIVAAVASALDYAHHGGLLHRDVKPANILLTEPDGQPRRVFLADFGIARRIDEVARLTSANMAVGTAAYAAPEQLMGAPLDGRADQYALACTAFHLLCGTRPYNDPNLAVVISQQITAPPPSIGARRPDLAGLDPVFATGMAKQPADRFGSCQEFAHLLRECLSGASRYTFATRPAPSVPVEKPRRSRVRIGALAAIALLVLAGGVVAGITLAQRPPPAAASGPLSGVYRADFGPITSLDVAADPTGAPELSGTYGLRSACGTAGCVATATRLSGAPVAATTMVFDQIGGRWVAVALGSDLCRSMPSEFWQVFTLQVGPGGALTGEYSATAGNGCAEKRTVSFTRTGAADDNQLPDPAGQPKRVQSPAEALHGRYRLARTFASGIPPQRTEAAVTTACLRTSDRCMSYFYSPGVEVPLVFDGANWASDIEQDAQCPGTRDTTHVKTTEQYSLPRPPQDPITLLTGRGHQAQSEPCALESDFDESFTRVGD